MAARGRLRTRDNLRGDIPCRLCPLCENYEETAVHIFFLCRISAIIWKDLQQWLHIPSRINSLPLLLPWIKRRARGNGMRATAIRLSCAAAVYYIWEGRNQLIWDHKAMDTGDRVRKIKVHVFRSMYYIFPNFVPTVNFDV
ncbi:hypothetical protein Dimus_037808 [Dionaea muscipula]